VSCFWWNRRRKSEDVYKERTGTRAASHEFQQKNVKSSDHIEEPVRLEIEAVVEPTASWTFVQ
jgi:hypothetical protein